MNSAHLLKQQASNDYSEALLRAINQPIEQQQRLVWMQQSRQRCQQQGISLQERQLWLQLSQQLCDWPMLKIWLAPDLSMLSTTGAQSREQYLQALQLAIHASWQLHDLVALEQLLMRLNLYFPEQQCPAWQALEQLSNSGIHCGNELVLRPMRTDDLESFFWLYEQDIAWRCNLPMFDSQDQWLQWLLEQQVNGAWLFAIMHQQWGLMGSVSIEVHKGSGFFYYWLGQDFQGYGFGPAAVSAVLTWAQHCIGLEQCFAKVYDHNQPSLYATQSLGFKPLACSLAPPYDNEVLFYLADHQDQTRLFDQLQQLITAMGCEYSLIPSLESLIDLTVATPSFVNHKESRYFSCFV